MKIHDRFSDVELADMFTIDCAPSCDRNESSRHAYIDEPYVFNDIKVPLWTITKRTPSRGEKHALQGEDMLRDGISAHPPGSTGRVADLAAHYAEVAADPSYEGESPFDC